ncbi:MAG: LptF/LptG family permease, partial [Pseudomonadota bacterium]
AEREAEIEANVTSRMLVEGRFLHPADGVTFYIREITAGGTLRDVFLSDARDPDSRTDYTAAEGFLLRNEATGSPALVMLDGSAQTFEHPNGQLTTTLFETFSYDLSALTGDAGRSRRDVREYPTHILFAPTEEALAETRRDPPDFFYEGHLRVVQPFTPAIAALLGFAALQLGGFSRFGVWRQIGLAVGLILFVQVGENAVADAARRDPSLWPLIYAPFVGGLAAALLMLAVAAAPAWHWRRVRTPQEGPA